MQHHKVIKIFVPVDEFCISFADHSFYFRLENNQGGGHRNGK